MRAQTTDNVVQHRASDRLGRKQLVGWALQLVGVLDASGLERASGRGREPKFGGQHADYSGFVLVGERTRRIAVNVSNSMTPDGKRQ